MAIPFYIPPEEDSSVSSTTNGPAGSGAGTSASSSVASSTQNSPAASPSRPIPIPLRNHNQQSPQSSPIDNEVLVQAFYEALCRCSQGSPMSAPMSPASPFNHGQFFFPRHTLSSPSTSTNSTPRHSFRVPRRRLNSHGSYVQQHDSDAEDESETPHEIFDWENHYQHREQLEEFSGRVPQPKKKKIKISDNEKPKSSEPTQKVQQKSKLTSFVISALQYVIDTLR